MPLDFAKILPLVMVAEVAYAARFPEAPATPCLILEIDAAGVRLTRPAKDGLSCAFMNVASGPVTAITQEAASVYSEIPKEAMPLRIELTISRPQDSVRAARLWVAGFAIDTPMVERRLPALLTAIAALAPLIAEAGQTTCRWAILTRLPASTRLSTAGEIVAASARGAILKFMACHLGCDSLARLEQVRELHHDLMSRTQVARIEALPGDRLLALADRDLVA